VIPNNSGLTAGLQFNNPQGFIGQSYSLAMNFQIDEFISPPPWVRLLSFTHVDDIGVYIYLTNPPTNGTLEFWPYGTVGEYNFFNTNDFYQLVLVRNEDGLIKIYINGQEFAEYDDSSTQKFVPGPPDNFIVFFRDHPSVLANEASFTMADAGFSIYDVSGRVMMQGPLNPGNNPIDIRSLKAGLYLVMVKNEQEIRTERVVKY
jgi:hypothetical protein